MLPARCCGEPVTRSHGPRDRRMGPASAPAGVPHAAPLRATGAASGRRLAADVVLRLRVDTHRGRAGRARAPQRFGPARSGSDRGGAPVEIRARAGYRARQADLGACADRVCAPAAPARRADPDPAVGRDRTGNRCAQRAGLRASAACSANGGEGAPTAKEGRGGICRPGAGAWPTALGRLKAMRDLGYVTHSAVRAGPVVVGAQGPRCG